MQEIAQAADQVWETPHSWSASSIPDTVDIPSRVAGKKRSSRTRKHRDTSHFRNIAGRLTGAQKSDQPTKLAPQLPTQADRCPAGHEWIHECKFDGYRLLAHRDAGGVRLLTRRGENWTTKFARLAAAIEQLPLESAILDGEVVVLGPQGLSDFQALQNSLSTGGGTHHFYLFDLPFCQGYDLRQVRLEERKQLLAQIVLPSGTGLLRYSDHIHGQGSQALEQACRLGMEGLVSKHMDSSYVSRRTRSWIKVKCVKEAEFLIGGFTEPKGSRTGLGALLLGSLDLQGRLIYCGRVGTGFDEPLLQELVQRLTPLITGEPPFANPPSGRESRDVHWTVPSWGSRADRVEAPDRLVFDLDPGEGVDWPRIVQGARNLRNRLHELGLTSFVRTTGGKGLHVVVPLVRRSDWRQAREFAEAVARQFVDHWPDRYVANMRKSLRHGKIFMDYLRNARGATAIASYSTRARVGAPVATPIAWDELTDDIRSDRWTLANLPARLAELSADPWEGFDQLRQSITKKMLAAVRR